MLARIIKIASSILWLVGLIGYFTLPEDWPIAVERMGRIAMWFDRDALVIILLATSSVGFAWVTFAPTVQRWWQKRKEPALKIEFPAEINSDGKFGPNKRSTMYQAREGGGRVVVVEYCFDLTNTTQRTIRNVSVQVHRIDNPLPFPLEKKLNTQAGSSSVDLAPGYTEFFRIGYAHRYDRDAVGEHVQIVSASHIDELNKRWPHNPGLMLVLENGRLPLLKNNNLTFIVGVYADNIGPALHRFRINCRERVEFFYDGIISPDEIAAPRQRPNAED